MNQLQTLYELQRYDTEIREKKHRLGEVLRAQKEPAALIALRTKADTLAQELHMVRGRHKDLALELAGINDKAQSSEQRLYSGLVKNPKELTDLQHEIESLARRRDVLETEVLEAIMAVEAQEAKLQLTLKEQEELTAEWVQSVESLQEEQQTLAIRLVQLGQLRDRKAAGVNPAMLKTYDRLAAQKGGVAVAHLKGNKCMSCQVTVPADRVRDAERDILVYCDSCGRILCAR